MKLRLVSELLPREPVLIEHGLTPTSTRTVKQLRDSELYKTRTGKEAFSSRLILDGIVPNCLVRHRSNSVWKSDLSQIEN